MFPTHTTHAACHGLNNLSICNNCFFTKGLKEGGYMPMGQCVLFFYLLDNHISHSIPIPRTSRLEGVWLIFILLRHGHDDDDRKEREV